MAKKKENKKIHHGLKLQHALFADWYIKLMNITEAAIRAGYSKRSAYSTGSDLLKKPEIQKYIQMRKTQLEELFGFNKGTLIKDLLTIKDKSMQAVPVMRYDARKKEYVQATEQVEQPNGNVTEEGVYQYDSNGANRAIENISKMMGYNAPEQSEDVTPPEKKTPQAVVINKQYVNQEPDKSTS